VLWVGTSDYRIYRCELGWKESILSVMLLHW